MEGIFHMVWSNNKNTCPRMKNICPVINPRDEMLRNVGRKWRQARDSLTEP